MNTTTELTDDPLEPDFPAQLYKDLSTGKRAELAVDIRGLVKRYGEFQALKGASFNVRAGEVHALMGQNGAGKSTLIKVLAGAEASNGGILRLFGEDKTFRSPLDASEAGIAVVYQDLSLVPSMTVAENLFLGRELTWAGLAINKSLMVERTRELLLSYGLSIDPKAKVADLPFAYKQMTEIAKALMSDARILILDEPTSALTDEEAEILFGAVRSVASRGVAVIYVTHRLNEVFKLCNRVTVMRDGQTAGVYDVADLDIRTLSAAIVGQKSDENGTQSTADKARERMKRRPSFGGAPAVELLDVTADKVRSASLKVERGEVVGLAGALGSGRTEILDVMFGLRKLTSGEMRLDGTARRFRDPADAIAAGVGLVPEDRHSEGLVLSHSIERNISMPSIPRLTRFGYFLKRRGVRRAIAAIRELAIKAQSHQSPLSSLSGGNQQKVVFAKWGEPRCSLLLLDEPTVGVDVGAREELYGEIYKAAEQGTGVLVVSSDLSELLLLCDRIYVVQNQTIQGEFLREEIESEEDLQHRIHTKIDKAQEMAR